MSVEKNSVSLSLHNVIWEQDNADFEKTHAFKINETVKTRQETYCIRLCSEIIEKLLVLQSWCFTLWLDKFP